MVRYFSGILYEANKYVNYLIKIDMLKPFEEGVIIAKSEYLPSERTLIIASTETKMIKFYEIPKIWRDASLQAE